jgi:predicted  nucleic acid-binding Zn-ribbon protein
VKIRGTCQNCGRDFLVQQVLDSGGHCPNCGKPFQPHYTAVLAEALQQAEAAGSALEGALEKLAGMEPNFVLDDETVLARIQTHLEELRTDARDRAERAAEAAAR